jgi:hypothetical protein
MIGILTLILILGPFFVGFFSEQLNKEPKVK